MGAGQGGVGGVEGFGVKARNGNNDEICRIVAGAHGAGQEARADTQYYLRIVRQALICFSNIKGLLFLPQDATATAIVHTPCHLLLIAIGVPPHFLPPPRALVQTSLAQIPPVFPCAQFQYFRSSLSSRTSSRRAGTSRATLGSWLGGHAPCVGRRARS